MMTQNFSQLQLLRLKYEPKLPKILNDLPGLLVVDREVSLGNASIENIFPNTIGQLFLKFETGGKVTHNPLKVGVVLSGGQAAGGHNVITGIFDALKTLNQESVLYGFLNGPAGIFNNQHTELTEEFIAPFRNQGGFDMIGSGRDKIETPDQFEGAKRACLDLDLDGLVVIGGDDSNTNAAMLAEYFLKEGVKTRVVGVPKTMDGDLKNDQIEISFGFDTATKTFCETIGNIARDSISAKKYYYFIKLMGRSASHITLECALQTHPNMALIGEEVAKGNKTLRDLTNDIADMICSRAENKKNYGVILIPEGVVEFIPEMKMLIEELNRMDLSGIETRDEKIAYAKENLSPQSYVCFETFPPMIQAQLLLDRDPHGNVQVSKIETERLFIEAVRKELKKRKETGEYVGKFGAQPHFCGYEGRSCLPSNFDAQYCYALGHVAALLIDQKKTGYMACVKDLTSPVEEWQIAGAPLTSMIHMEERKGKMKPVIAKALVELDDTPFKTFKDSRERWKVEDDYIYPGPIQFFGPPEATDQVTNTLDLCSR